MSTTEPVLTLAPLQLGALIIFMAEAREVNNGELEEMAGFRLDGKDRREIEDEWGLVESRKVGRQLAFQLTEKGWVFCKQLHETTVNVGRSRAARSIFVLLGGLHRSLDRLRVSHGEFFKQAVIEEPPPAPVEDGGIESHIRAAYAELAGTPGGWVGLADLRENLGDLDRSAVDDTLRVMARQDGVRIIPLANSKALRGRDRAAALRIGSEDNHALSIGSA